MGWGRDYNGKNINFQCLPVSSSFLKVMGIEVKEGRDFRPEDDQKETGCYIFNEKAKAQLELKLNEQIDGDEIIGDIMHENVISINTLMDQEEVARQFKKYDFTAMPVVDNENRLVGIITVDDIVDIIEEETTEDMEKMAAIVPSDKPYMKTGVFETFKKRIPWLLLLMVSATFTGAIISSFEDALSVCAVLVAYIPMLMDTGGNCGSQSSVTVIRSLSLGELHFKDLFKVWWKEARVAVMCGVTLAVANFVKLLLIERVGVPIALTICLTLCVTVFIAKMVGCTLPILADKLGFDPAVMASPFITTIVDALALLIYCAFAGMILGLA